jgi:hypothetical protein
MDMEVSPNPSKPVLGRTQERMTRWVEDTGTEHPGASIGRSERPSDLLPKPSDLAHIPGTLLLWG